MKIIMFIIVLVLLILTVFTAANWSVLTTPTPLSFVAFSVEGPLGVILLGIMMGLVLLVVAYSLLLRTTTLVESRRLNRQLAEQRELAQQAETSRFSVLQEMIGIEFEKTRKSIELSGAEGITRLESAEQSMTKSLEEAVNSLTADLGYLDDRLKNRRSSDSSSKAEE